MQSIIIGQIGKELLEKICEYLKHYAKRIARLRIKVYTERIGFE